MLFILYFDFTTIGGSGALSTEAAVEGLLEKVAELEAKLASSTVAAVDSSSTENQNVSQPTNTSLRLRIKPEYFSAAPGDNWFTWVRKFKNIAQLNNWKDDVTQKVLPAYLKGRAEQIYYSLKQEELASWVTVESALTKRFHPPESQQLHRAALHARVRGKEEDLQQLQCDISHLVGLAYPNDPPTIRDRTAKNFFIGALTPLSLKEKVLDMNPQTLDDSCWQQHSVLRQTEKYWIRALHMF